MKNKPVQLSSRTINVLSVLFLALGLLVRIFRFGTVPGGINVDEAFAGYEAWSILTTGMDTSGHRLPVYLTAWGSGMNALNSYLMIPFIALFGLKTWVIRLPQLIVACLSLPVVWHLVKKTSNERNALFALMLTAVCPWHVLLSRWGLESNLAPGFMLYGMYFFVCGLDKPKLLPLSALMYGLSLYCYAAIWPVVPFLLLAQILYVIRCRKLKPTGHLIVSAVILTVLATPLILFLLVNMGWMDEINLPFLSIPKLVFWRGNEVSASNILDNFKTTARILIFQNDGLLWNCAGPYGLIYHFTVPFFLIGLVFSVIRTVRSIRSREFSLDVFLLFQLIAGSILGLSISAVVNRINILFIPMLMISASGIADLCRILRKNLAILICCTYIILFGFFANFYFTDYSRAISTEFLSGMENAIREAQRDDSDICISADISYSGVLFHSMTDPDVYRKTVQYREVPYPILIPTSFGQFRFQSLSEISVNGPDPEVSYIFRADSDLSLFTDAGFTVEPMDSCVLVRYNP